MYRMPSLVTSTNLVFLSSNWVSSVAYSPCGKWIISGSYDNTVRIWDAATGAAVGSPLMGDITTGDKQVYCVAFSPDGNTLAAGDGGFVQRGNVRLYDVHTGEVKSTLTGHRYDLFPCIECLLL